MHLQSSSGACPSFVPAVSLHPLRQLVRAARRSRSPQAQPEKKLRSPCTIAKMENEGRARDSSEVYAESAGTEISHVGRRQVGLQVGLGALLLQDSSEYPAEAITLQEATPARFVSGELPAAEAATANLFETNTYSVVNVFDLTTRNLAASAAQVDVPEGNGSGIVWDDTGNVVTNYHVLGSILSSPQVSRMRSVAKVTLLTTSGVQQEYDAELVGTDRSKDLAVLRIRAPPNQLRPITLGSSKDARVGQQCFAIGNPFGFDHTLTTGVISGLDRQIQSQVGSTISGGLQTDAAINPGNSGGPLLDSSGRLIGINTAIFTNSGTSAGVGFAIPADTVRRIVPQLIEYGRVVRPSLGVQVANPGIAKQLSVKTGVLVQAVMPKGSAELAGILPTRRGLGGIIRGDVILAVGDKMVSNATDLEDAIEAYSVGDIVRLQVERQESKDKVANLDITVQLKEESTK